MERSNYVDASDMPSMPIVRICAPCALPLVSDPLTAKPDDALIVYCGTRSPRQLDDQGSADPVTDTEAQPPATDPSASQPTPAPIADQLDLDAIDHELFVAAQEIENIPYTAPEVIVGRARQLIPIAEHLVAEVRALRARLDAHYCGGRAATGA